MENGIETNVVHPLGANILNWQQYNTSLSSDASLVFDWLVVKFKSFGYKEFYYSMERIEGELRMKRHRLEVALNLWQRKGILVIVKKGTPYQRFYSLNLELLANKNTLSTIYNMDRAPQALPYFQKLLSEMKTAMPKRGGLGKKSVPAEPAYLINLLNQAYNQRREMHSKKLKATLKETKLPINQIQKNKLAIIESGYGHNAVKLAFVAYVDSILEGNETPDNVLNLFLKYDDNLGSWPVFEKYLSIYNNDYSVK